MIRFAFAVLLTCAACQLAMAPAVAVESTAELPMTSERELAALQFARQHHPELAQLLEQLKGKNQRQYSAAIRDLSKTIERLERLRSRQPERYETELQIWQLDSQIRLLVARLVSEPDPALDEELRGLLKHRNVLILKQLEADRDRLAARVERLDESIDELKSHGEDLIEKEFHRLQQNARSRAVTKSGDAGAGSGTNSNSKKPAPKVEK